MTQQFRLQWTNYVNNNIEFVRNLFSTEAMVDVTLACDGMSLKAHKVVLSSCSPFFHSLFLKNPCKHPIVILNGIKYTDLKTIVKFMYHGEVNVDQDQVPALLKTAETLRVKGLSDVISEQSLNNEESSIRTEPQTGTRPPKRRRGRPKKRLFSNRSNDDVSSVLNITQPYSPTIDDILGVTDTTSRYSSITSSRRNIPMQNIYSCNSNSFHKLCHQQQDQSVDHSDVESFVPEDNFREKSSELAEQSLRMCQYDLPEQSIQPSVQSNMGISRLHESNTDNSTGFLPALMPSGDLSAINKQTENPPTTTPELIELDPPTSPVAGPSHTSDENSRVVPVDQSKKMFGLLTPTSYHENSDILTTDSKQEGFDCKTCNMWFSLKLRFRLHNIWYHKRDLPEFKFNCKDCPYATNLRASYLRHFLEHDISRPYICNICSNRFTNMQGLFKHYFIHSGEQRPGAKRSLLDISPNIRPL